MSNVVVFGDEKFNDYNMLRSVLDFHFNDKKVTVIVRKRRGADAYARVYADAKELPTKPLEWNEYTEQAVLDLISNEASYGIAFYNGFDSDTWKIISALRSAKKKVVIINYEKVAKQCLE